TSIEIVTPENIAFEYRVAGPFRRLPAYLIDLAIRGLAFGVGAAAVTMVLALIGLGTAGIGFGFVWWFLLTWFYGGVLESYFNGQTPGKRLLGIRVVTVEGQPINAVQAILRNFLRIVDSQPAVQLMGWPMMYLVGLTAAAMNDRFQRLGDLAAGTMVVIEEQQWFQGIVRLREPAAVELAARMPADFQASRTLARALATYVERRETFSMPRRLEIARHLGEPYRQQFGFPANMNLDLLLCAMYHRAFITDRDDLGEVGSPFRQQPTLPVRLNDPVDMMARMDRR
ncbi:MAG: RDD family protein, partial [Candidatus Nealsonbacteria bacterium]|nr:RDD family protein [Candidatus Nealsonbacteria bacterium]